MVTHPDGTVEMYDSSGTVRVRMGDLTKGGFMSNSVHITYDGEYVTSYIMDPTWYKKENQRQMMNSYPGHQAWCRSADLDGSWYTIPVAGIGFSRWDSVAENNVPEVVRVAELMR